MSISVFNSRVGCGGRCGICATDRYACYALAIGRGQGMRLVVLVCAGHLLAMHEPGPAGGKVLNVVRGTNSKQTIGVRMVGATDT